MLFSIEFQKDSRKKSIDQHKNKLSIFMDSSIMRVATLDMILSFFISSSWATRDAWKENPFWQ